MKQAAERKNVTFESIRQGGSHEIFQLDGLMIPIPRHNEIDNNLADIICKEAEAKLGKSAVKTYQVIVRPGEKYWILEIPGIGFTQARTTAEIESMARDLITVMTQDADFALTVETKLPQSVQEHLDEARRLRKEEAECRSNAARETRAAAQELHGMGLALQQRGDILGVSRQRAHQLVNA